MTTLEIMQQAKACRMQLTQATGQQKNDMLLAMADALVASQEAILAANAQDLAAAKGQISDVMLDRLALDASRITAMATGMRQVAALPDPVGETLRHVERPNGLQHRPGQRAPGRRSHHLREPAPMSPSDAAALALKSGNACILRGGKEAFRSADAIVRALQDGLDRRRTARGQLVQLVQDTSRASADRADDRRRLYRPADPPGRRGADSRSCVANAKVPCIQTGTGICHLYVDAVCGPRPWHWTSSKTPRPAAPLSAMRRRSCLVHQEIAARCPPCPAGTSGGRAAGGGAAAGGAAALRRTRGSIIPGTPGGSGGL